MDIFLGKHNLNFSKTKEFYGVNRSIRPAF
jgi:hypothetical protein